MGSITVDGPTGFNSELTFQLFNEIIFLDRCALFWDILYCTLSILQIGEEKSTVIGLMRKAISQQFTDEVSKLHSFSWGINIWHFSVKVGCATALQRLSCYTFFFNEKFKNDLSFSLFYNVSVLVLVYHWYTHVDYKFGIAYL